MGIADFWVSIQNTSTVACVWVLLLGIRCLYSEALERSALRCNQASFTAPRREGGTLAGISSLSQWG